MKTKLLVALLLLPSIGFAKPTSLQNAACMRLDSAVFFALSQYNRAYHGLISVDSADQSVASQDSFIYSPYIFKEIHINSLSELIEITTRAGEQIFTKKLKPAGFSKYQDKIKSNCLTMSPVSAETTSHNHDYSK